MRFSRLLSAALLIPALALAADPALISLLPKDPNMMAGLDFTRAKNSPFGQRILSEMKDEDAHFKEFVATTGFDPRRDLIEVVVATDGKQKPASSLVLVRGNFDPAKLSAFIQTKGSVKSIYKGVELWTDSKNQEGSLAIVDSSLAMFGGTDAVKGAIDRRGAGAPALSPAVLARVNEWSMANDAWVVSNVPFADMGVNSDGKNQVLPQGFSADTIRAASAGVRFGKSLELSGDVITKSDKDAQSLADMVRFLASLVKMNANKPGADEAAKVLESLQLSTDGATMKFYLAVPEDMLNKMLENKRQASTSQAKN
jgi:hypothetical protein